MTSQVNHLQPLSGNEADQYWMKHALGLAQQAKNFGEVPVGAVLVFDNQIIAEAHNQSIMCCDPSAHAEIQVLRKAAEKINNYRLINTSLYVTLEPCMMCAGAIVHARVNQLIYGAVDKKSGAVVSHMQVLDQPFLNHSVQHRGGILQTACGEVLSQFFKEKRRA